MGFFVVTLDCSVRGLPGVGVASATWATLVANDRYNCQLMSSGGSVVAGLPMKNDWRRSMNS